MDEQAIERLERVMETGFATLADLQRETNTRLDRHEHILERHGEILERHGHILERQGHILERHGQYLERHEQALVKLVRGMDTLNDRFDRFLTGPHRDEHEALRSRVDRIESHLGLEGE